MEINTKLLEKAKKGDLGAFEEIVSLFERPIFSFVYRLLGNRQDAEDATQETFVKLYKKIGKADTSQNFKSWIYTIATNTAYDILRKRKHVVETELEEAILIPDETETGEDPYYQADRQFDAGVVQSHLLKLKPAQRSVILLHYNQDFSIEQIAAITGLPTGTIKTHLHRGRNELKKIIAKYYEPQLIKEYA